MRSYRTGDATSGYRTEVWRRSKVAGLTQDLEVYVNPPTFAGGNETCLVSYGALEALMVAAEFHKIEERT
jgi:hypothetical protein